MSYYPKPDSYIRDKVKVVLDVSNYATKRDLKYATEGETSNLATQSDFIALKADVDKLYINKLVNILTGLKHSKIKVDDLDYGKSKIAPIDLKNLSDVVSKKAIKNTVYRKLNTNLCNLEKKFSDATTPILKS